ncbi:TlpA disulfide reductase family protein [Fluviicola sp.]|uniref:TlpA family protein disulfide reductase n=1 Tax=Fluviicola sp. TaxID=1917219 RepID=UPI0031DFFD34
MKFCAILLTCLITIWSFHSCSDAGKKREFKFYLVNLTTKDTLFKTRFDKGEVLKFKCPEDVKQQVLVASVLWKNSQINAVVPVKPGALNNYLVNIGTLKNGNHQQRLIHFSGNHYLNDYEQFLTRIARSEKDTSVLVNAFVENLADFSKKYPKSELTGYHIHSILTTSSEESFTTHLNNRNRVLWQTLLDKADDSFAKELKRMQKANELGNCIQSDPGKLVFQSKTSSIDPAVLEDNLKVVIFWATWCGPCKPQMKQLAALNQKKYLNEPVLFVGVTSESDPQLVFSWIKQNEQKYKGLILFHDSHFCMSTNYAISQYPTILIFDKQDKLIQKGVKIDEVESLIDSLLKK